VPNVEHVHRVPGLAAVDDVAGTDGLTCLGHGRPHVLAGEGAQGVWVGLDLGGFANSQVGLKGVHYRLVHAALVSLGVGGHRKLSERGQQLCSTASPPQFCCIFVQSDDRSPYAF